MYLVNGEIIKGDAVACVEALCSMAYDSSRFVSLDDYMVWFSQQLFRLHGLGVAVTGEKLEDRCSSLVRQLVAAGMVEPV